MNDNKFDVLIIGSGAAGLSSALRLPSSTRIAIVSKRELREGNTYYAQGGISAVLDAEDSLASHIQDTLDAGGGIGDATVVRNVVERGPDNISWLRDQGMNFTHAADASGTDYHLTREGGHSHRRVAHSADATGRALSTSLEDRVRAQTNIKIIEHHIAVDLILEEKSDKNSSNRCIGAYLLDIENEQVTAIAAQAVIIATGGSSKAYLYTSNPDVATGDGIAMAWRAGCRVANMEFIQFHPTCLYHPEAKSFLISEAVRGEGGKLTLPDGSAFMHKYDSREELAPRDIVARAIDFEMKRQGFDYVNLDISFKSASFIHEHFPTIYERCISLGIDITKEPVPVVPAAHYTCGGIIVDQQAKTDIVGLYAIGESTYTGLHGANRMASNSLLECLVYGELAANAIVEQLKNAAPLPTPTVWDDSRVTDSDEEVVVTHNWDELRRFMWDYVGIVRSNKRLQRARNRVDLLQREIREYYSNFTVNNDLLELRNLADVADLIITSAQRRRESRGLHYNIDFPYLDDAQAKPTILIPDNYAPYSSD